MAVIGLKSAGLLCALGLLVSPIASSQAPESENNKQSAQARAVIGSVADALTSGNAADAIAHFDKAFPKYDTLNNDFNGLVNAFYISNEIEILDEEDAPAETKLTVRWAMTLTDLQTYYTEDRTSELNVRLTRKGDKWRIAAFSPISLFDPAKGATVRSGPKP